jgi:squalene synthase HpnC
MTQAAFTSEAFPARGAFPTAAGQRQLQPQPTSSSVMPPAGLAPVIWAGLEPSDDGPEAAEAYTRRLAHSHYENFSVVSMLLPRHLRQDFCNVYAFCRIADDLGDELDDPRESLRQLARLRAETHSAYEGRAGNRLFTALGATIRRHSIPVEPFLDLIDAFEQDQRISRYEDFGQLLDYCRRSANPVGRLVLYLCGYRDAERQRLSDQTCTALQLANFWQDVRRDLLDRDRIYLPADSMRRFGVTEDQIRAGRCDDHYRALLRFEVERTLPMFAEGRALLPMLRPSVRRQVALFGAGGMAVLDAIRRQDYDTLTRRPKLSKWQKGRLILAGLTAAALNTVVNALAGGDGGATVTTTTTQPRQAPAMATTTAATMSAGAATTAPHEAGRGGGGPE